MKMWGVSRCEVSGYAVLMSKLTSNDALLPADITEKDKSTFIGVKVLKALVSKPTLGVFDEKKTFNHVHLDKLALSTRVENVWILTTAGDELICCVCVPQ